jgi:hypothetical protein
MATWRKVHIGNDEWKWVRSKTRYAVVIKDPRNNKLYTVPFEAIDPPPPGDPSPWSWPSVATPGKVRAYIEANLLDD